MGSVCAIGAQRRIVVETGLAERTPGLLLDQAQREADHVREDSDAIRSDLVTESVSCLVVPRASRAEPSAHS